MTVPQPLPKPLGLLITGPLFVFISQTRMFFPLTFSVLLSSSASDLADIADVAVASGRNVEARHPRLFYVSSTSTTTTITTTTLCYMDIATKAACGRRKRRRAVTFDSLSMDGVTRVDTDGRQVLLVKKLVGLTTIKI